MSFWCCEPARLSGTVDDVATDKSISHRVAIFSLLSDRPSRVQDFLQAEDTLSSLAIAKALGAEVLWEGETLTITPPEQIIEPASVLDCGNAGTGMRLFAGLLSACEGHFVLSGDRYLNARPMKRVADPLRSIGAQVDGRQGGNYAPLAIRGNPKPRAFRYDSPVASAQVKSALILAGLFADGPSQIREPELSRDHTERMLSGMGAQIDTQGGWITIKPLKKPLKPLAFSVPSDPSSAFFFAVAAAVTPGASVTLKNLTLNPTRTEAYRVLERMGAQVRFELIEDRFEPIGDIHVAHGPLQAVRVQENMAWLIDELPALAIAMACAEGTSVVEEAAELRVKESDRISSTVGNLKRCGINAKERADGFEITGGTLEGATIESCGDHRIAMSFAIAALVARGAMRIEDTDCVATSFPAFAAIYRRLGGVLKEG
jgi:3-phosphoshikimate 1-carboxyvinyltransferase